MDLSIQPLRDEEFHLLRELIKARTGIALSDAKGSLVQARLAKRLRSLSLRTYREYYEYLKRDPRGEEWVQFINAMTTNTTAFFREPHHFTYLREVWLPTIRSRGVKTGKRRIRIWSAGCSTGEEPYSIAITLSEGLPNLLGWDVQILASDIDTEALARAESGVYPRDRVQTLPETFIRRYFQKGVEGDRTLFRILPRVRNLVTFRRINLLEEPWPIQTPFDVIFCRNVMIYFDKATQKKLCHRFKEILKEGGLLFLGHSEGLLGMETGLRHLGQTIYQK